MSTRVRVLWQKSCGKKDTGRPRSRLRCACLRGPAAHRVLVLASAHDYDGAPAAARQKRPPCSECSRAKSMRLAPSPVAARRRSRTSCPSRRSPLRRSRRPRRGHDGWGLARTSVAVNVAANWRLSTTASSSGGFGPVGWDDTAAKSDRAKAVTAHWHSTVKWVASFYGQAREQLAFTL